MTTNMHADRARQSERWTAMVAAEEAAVAAEEASKGASRPHRAPTGGITARSRWQERSAALPSGARCASSHPCSYDHRALILMSSRNPCAHVAAAMRGIGNLGVHPLRRAERCDLQLPRHGDGEWALTLHLE